MQEDIYTETKKARKYSPPAQKHKENTIHTKLQEKLKENNAALPENTNLHSVYSRIGKKIEDSLVSMARIYHRNNCENVETYTGDDINNKILSWLKSDDENLKNELEEKFLMSRSFLDNIEEKHKKQKDGKPKKKGMPDIVSIDWETSPITVRVAEVKSSGNNDSTSVPGNVDKMISGTENSAIEAWAANDNIVLERAILIAAASEKTKGGEYRVKAKWKSCIDKKGADIEVHANEEICSWLAGINGTTQQEYVDTIIGTAAQLEVETYI